MIRARMAGQTGTLATGTLEIGTLAMLLGALAVTGCVTPGPPVYQPSTARFAPNDDVAVLLAPPAVNAPVGSQVVLVAGVRAGDGLLRGSRRLEWSLAPGSAGQFVNVGDVGVIDWLMGDLTIPRIQDPHQALGLTLRRPERLVLPGGAQPVAVLAGQGWISVYSAVPGTSMVTVFAPDVVDPAGRVQTAVVHWVSPSLGVPAPPINPVAVPRPAGLTVHKTGPATAAIGQTLTYHIEVLNPGDIVAKDVLASDEIPEGVSYVGSTPPAELSGKRLQWRLGDLAPRQPRAIDLTLRAEQQGSLTNCVEVTAAGGALKANDCATTTISGGGAPAGPATIDVQISTPPPVTLGGDALFEVVITNRGASATVPLLIKDHFGAGLVHAKAPSPIERKLGVLNPNESRRITVTFRTTQPGRQCHTVDVTGDDGSHGSAEGCVMVEEPPKAVAEKPALSAKMTGPPQVKVGETAKFLIEIANNGSQELHDLKVTDRYDPSMIPTDITEGHKEEGKNAISWTIPSLPAHKKVQFEIDCTCTAAGPKVCNRSEVSGPEGGNAEAEAYVEVLAGPPTAPAAGSGLTLDVNSLAGPVAVHKALTYEIRVGNKGLAPEEQVVVTVTLPVGMTVDPFGTSGPAESKYTIDGANIRFTAIPVINAGSNLTYRVHVLAQQIGTFHVHAEMTSHAHPEPITAEKTTDVVQR